MREVRGSILDGPAPGASLVGFRVRRVIETRPDLYTVVEAEGPNGRRVALTLLGPPLAEGRESRRAVLRLARLRASMVHPHLLEFYGAVQSENQVYLVSALPGSDTLERLLQEDRLAAGEVLTILGQVAGALETAAARGLTHRDLTPGAVAIQDQRALLTDFGIAASSALGCRVLNLDDACEYRSPEEVRGQTPEPESNVYSLACILVRCLTGAAPYSHDRPILTLHAHMVEPPPQISQRRPDLPPELDAVVARGMAKDPGDRYPSAAHLIREAGRALSIDVPVPVRTPPHEEARPPVKAPRRPVTAPPRVGAARRTRRTTAWVALALFASVGTGFATGGVQWSAAPSPPPVASPPAPPKDIERVAYTHEVSTAVRRLRARRVAARKRLHEARSPRGQAAAANALASAYRQARAGLPPAPPSGATGRGSLAKKLREAERAYRRLDAAASQSSRRSWRVARRQTLRREAALQRELRGVRRG